MPNTKLARSTHWLIGALIGILAINIINAGCATGTAQTMADPPNPSGTSGASLQGDTYYVAPNGHNSNPGTETQPWRTIQKAADTLVAGETVYIKAGTYEEQIIPRYSGNPDNPIVYAAYPGDRATIDGAYFELPPYESGLIVVEDRHYITISGLRIENAGPHDNNAGIYVDTSSHIIIENNHTYNTVSSGIGVWNSENIIIDGNEVELGCNDGEQEVITVANTDTFEIKNNHVHHGGPGSIGGEGIDAKDGSRNGKIFNNHVHHMRADRTCLYLDAWDKHTFNIEVYQNLLHNCSAGITLASESGGLLEDIKVYNNIIYHNRYNGLEIGEWGEPGVTTHPVENVAFINNTVYGNGTAGWGGGWHNENSDAANIVVRNNIFSQNLSFQIADESPLAPANLTIDHNLIDGFRDYEGETRGSDYVEGDPLFWNASEAQFRLFQGSPAIDTGSDLEAPSQDFAGVARPQDGDGDSFPAYDIGAYEKIVYSEFVYLPLLTKIVNFPPSRTPAAGRGQHH
jgi:hypothetical protein